MCGIIGIIKKEEETEEGAKTTSERILDMLEEQITRGREGFGYVSFNEQLTMFARRQTKDDIEKALKANNTRSIIFHHRLPTSTPNYADCAHPIFVSNKELKHDYYLVHNGVIGNCSVLHDEHVELGYVYTTTVTTKISTENSCYQTEKFNDSESLAIDLARFIEGKQDIIKSSGSIAFILVQKKKGKKDIENIYFGRNSSPLTMKYTTDELVLRSQGENEIVTTDTMYTFNLKEWKIESQEVTIGVLSSTRNNYGFGGGDNADDDDWYSRDRTPIRTPTLYDNSSYDDTTDDISDDAPNPREYGVSVYDDEGNEYLADSADASHLVELQQKLDDLEEEIEENKKEAEECRKTGYPTLAQTYEDAAANLEIQASRVEGDINDLFEDLLPVPEAIEVISQ